MSNQPVSPINQTAKTAQPTPTPEPKTPLSPKPATANPEPTETQLLKAKRSFTAAPLQRDVRVIQKGEEFEATPEFAVFALEKKWVTENVKA